MKVDLPGTFCRLVAGSAGEENLGRWERSIAACGVVGDLGGAVYRNAKVNWVLEEEVEQVASSATTGLSSSHEVNAQCHFTPTLSNLVFSRVTLTTRVTSPFLSLSKNN